MRPNVKLQAFSLLTLLIMIPFLTAGQGIEITSGASIEVTGAATLEINGGSFINNGTYTKGNETVTMSGTSAGFISGSSLSGFNNLTISNSGGISIDDNSTVTVGGTLINSGDATKFKILSTSVGAGSLIHNTVSVPATVQRYIAAASWGEYHDGWHLLSSPVDNQAISGNWTPSGTDNNYDFYAWSESALSNNWLNQKVPGNNITSFLTGKGYLVAYQQTGIKEFAGNLNSGAVSHSGMTHTIGNYYGGWHLVGNPYPCAVNWSTGSWAKTNLGANAKIWVEATKSYKDVTGDYNNIIPAMNGFMVYVNESSTGALTIPVDARLHNSTNWLKTTPSDYIILTACENEGSSAQESIIRINSSATEGFDPDYDSKFMAGFAPSFFSVAEGNFLSLNTIPGYNEKIIEMGFVKNGSSTFSIRLNKSNLIPGLSVYLTDKKTGHVTNLSNLIFYNFTSLEGDDVNRFLLHFSTVGIDDNIDIGKPGIYASGSVVYVSTTLEPAADVYIYDLMGRIVRQVRVSGKSLTTINAAGLTAGIYIVSVKYDNSIFSTKVVLNN